MKKLLLYPFLIGMMFMGMAQSKSYLDVVYATTEQRDLLVDIYLPENNKKPYLMIWVHGGAWHSGQKENPPLGLLKHGFAIASIDYRLSIEAPLPAMVHDIKASIRFIRAQAKKYGYRSDKIGIYGSSAGGHLVALVGTTNGNKFFEGDLGEHTDESSDVQVVIDYFGPTNFTTILKQSTPHGISVRGPALALLLGKPLEKAEELAKKSSPVFQVDSTDPPMMIIHGEQDIQVPVNQSIEMDAAYQKHGLSSKLLFLPGAGHGGDAFWEPEIQGQVVDFILKAFK